MCLCVLFVRSLLLRLRLLLLKQDHASNADTNSSLPGLPVSGRVCPCVSVFLSVCVPLTLYSLAHHPSTTTPMFPTLTLTAVGLCPSVSVCLSFLHLSVCTNLLLLVITGLLKLTRVVQLRVHLLQQGTVGSDGTACVRKAHTYTHTPPICQPFSDRQQSCSNTTAKGREHSTGGGGGGGWSDAL